MRSSIVVALIAAAVSGCQVGPDYRGPPALPLEVASGGGFIRAGDRSVSSPPVARWWRPLNDHELDQLEDRALQNAPGLAIAVAKLRQARAGLRLKQADRRPEAGGFAAYVRSQDAIDGLGGAANALPASFTSNGVQLYDAGFDAAWEPDLFGGEARAVEGAQAGAQAAEFDLADAEVSLTADVAQAYLTLRTLQAQLAHVRRSVAIEAELLAMTTRRRAEGAATDLDVERLRNQLETTQTQVPPLLAQLNAQQDRLAVLTGQTPGSLDLELQAPAPIPLPPPVTPVGNPAALLRRRPDIRAAERRIEQQNALIGVRTADLFPKVSLVGDIGVGGADLGGVLTATSLAYGVAPVLHWSPLDFGRTEARIAQARAARDEAEDLYRRTVLSALEDAETALARYGRQAESLAGLIRVKASADRLSHLTELQWRGGTVTSLDLLEAERRRLEAEADVVAAEGMLTQDYVSLQKSLGLGWGAP